MVIPHMRTFLFILLIAVSFSATSQGDIQLANEYYQAGEQEKALVLYRKLAKSRNDIQSLHSNYFNLLVQRNEFGEAESYLKRISRWFPNNNQYRIDLIFLYATTEKTSNLQKEFEGLKSKVASNQYQLNFLAQSFVNKELYDYAVDFLMLARTLNGRPGAYALDLAAVYRIKGDKEKMVDEYLAYALANPANLNYIKNIFQNLFAEEEDLQFLEQALIKRIQKNPDEFTFSELLIWIELQRKNFYGAFLQARAMDKRQANAGDQTMRIGRIALENQSWNDAIKIFEYIIAQYRRTHNYGNARRSLIQAKEGLIKSQYPVNKTAIRELTIDYQNLYNELGPNQVTLEAMRNKALLHAFYLDESAAATKILNDIISIPRLGNALVSKCKLDLGDIYLLEDNPWEASLLYSQVEKSNKDSPTAYEAKLRNAKLNYYTGFFTLALSHLNILKKATTREISNDAIFLSLLIKNNTILDTSDLVMKKYAEIDLLNFQNKDSAALMSITQLLDEYPQHSIADECHWLRAQIYKKSGHFEKALSALDLIITSFGYDILADDAAFTKAEIVHYNLNQEEEAKNLYREFLTSFPGSLYAADARKRFRELRGDQLN